MRNSPAPDVPLDRVPSQICPLLGSMLVQSCDNADNMGKNVR
jgi:hypothetical protein